MAGQVTLGLCLNVHPPLPAQLDGLDVDVRGQRAEFLAGGGFAPPVVLAFPTPPARAWSFLRSFVRSPQDLPPPETAVSRPAEVKSQSKLARGEVDTRCE